MCIFIVFAMNRFRTVSRVGWAHICTHRMNFQGNKSRYRCCPSENLHILWSFFPINYHYSPVMFVTVFCNYLTNKKYFWNSKISWKTANFEHPRFCKDSNDLKIFFGDRQQTSVFHQCHTLPLSSTSDEPNEPWPYNCFLYNLRYNNGSIWTRI